jgi:nucleotide-binding universal stress UspA family protein
VRFVVGYVPSHRGTDAVNLAATLAGARDATLDIVVVLPERGPSFDMYSPDHAYHSALEQQGRTWLAEALAQLPEGVTASTRIERAESIAEGLMNAAADDTDRAGLIVIGAAGNAVTGRFTVGSVASDLLHSAEVPVALAPEGYQPHPQITRVTCALGGRPGADESLSVAIVAAESRGIPLRLMTLVAVAEDRAGDDRREWAEVAQRLEQNLVAAAAPVLPADYPVEVVVGVGDSLQDCVQELDFEASEIVVVGSSRLAGRKRLFIGPSANKILRALPVPMVVVPREYELSV